MVRAIATPYRSLALTFALVMIAEYLFSIFGFAFFRNQYVNVAALEANLSTAECGMLWSCFLTTVDQTFKNNGGVGTLIGMHKWSSKSYCRRCASQTNVDRRLLDVVEPPPL